MRNMVIYRLPVWLPAVLHSQSPLSRYGLMQRFQFFCRQCIATSNAVTMSARSHDDSFAEQYIENNAKSSRYTKTI